MDPHPQPVVLILADISGYTRFMLANQTAQVHGQMVVTKLLEAVIRQVEIPLEVNKIEGDAVFLYALRPADEEAWNETRRIIGRQLRAFFVAFSRALVVGAEFALCNCPSCQNVDQLRLKIVVHSGEAILHDLGRFSELTGVDVILAHRLLKNSVPGDEYVLMTEAAYREIEFPSDVEVLRGEENYEGFGAVATYTYLAEGSCTRRPEIVAALYADRGNAVRVALRILLAGQIGQLQALVRPVRPGEFRNLGESSKAGMSVGARAAMFLRILVMTPILLPLGVCIETWRALTGSTLALRRIRRRKA